MGLEMKRSKRTFGICLFLQYDKQQKDVISRLSKKKENEKAKKRNLKAVFCRRKKEIYKIMRGLNLREI